MKIGSHKDAEARRRRRNSRKMEGKGLAKVHVGWADFRLLIWILDLTAETANLAKRYTTPSA
jgi:hypothetical protein